MGSMDSLNHFLTSFKYGVPSTSCLWDLILKSLFLTEYSNSINLFHHCFLYRINTSLPISPFWSISHLVTRKSLLPILKGSSKICKKRMALKGSLRWINLLYFVTKSILAAGLKHEIEIYYSVCFFLYQCLAEQDLALNNLLVLQNFTIARKSGNILLTYWKHCFLPTLVRVWNVG